MRTLTADFHHLSPPKLSLAELQDRAGSVRSLRRHDDVLDSQCPDGKNAAIFGGKVVRRFVNFIFPVWVVVYRASYYDLYLLEKNGGLTGYSWGFHGLFMGIR